MIFYYDGNGAQGIGDGSSAVNASSSTSSAISSLGSGNSVEVTAGTFTLSAAEADGKTISGAGNVAVTAISSTLNANLSGIAVSGTKTGSFATSGIFTGNLGTLSVTVESGAVLSATADILNAGATFSGDLAITSAVIPPFRHLPVALRLIFPPTASAQPTSWWMPIASSCSYHPRLRAALAPSPPSPPVFPA